MSIEFGYWKLRSFGNPIRMILNYVEADFIEKTYEAHKLGDNKEGAGYDICADWDMGEWFKDKNSVEMKEKFFFPNLPWMVDGDVKLTQSVTIMKYLARKFKIGQNLTNDQQLRLDVLNDQFLDDRSSFYVFIYGMNQLKPNVDEEREKFCSETLKPQLGRIENFLDSEGFIAGAELTYLDFLLWEHLDVLSLFDSKLITDFPKISGYKNRFENLEKIKSFRESPRFMRSPIANKMSIWGGDVELSKPWEKDGTKF